MLKHKADFALAYQVLLLMQALLCLVRPTICGPSPSQHSPTTAPDQQVASVPDPHPRWACLLALADNRIWSQAFLWHSVAHIGIRWTKGSIKRWLTSYWWPLKAIQVMRWCSVCDWDKLKTWSSSQDQTMIHINVNFSPHAACFVALLQHESEIYCTNSDPLLFNYVDSSPQRHQ